MDVKEKMNVTVRVPLELYDDFQKKCKSNNETITDVLINHIRNQVNEYKEPKSSDAEYDNYSFKKANFRIEADLYADYKIELIKNRTTPTADIIRFIRQYV